MSDRTFFRGTDPQPSAARLLDAASRTADDLTTDQGDMILDNLSAWILHWDQTGYRWIERQTPGQPFDWRTVEAS